MGEIARHALPKVFSISSERYICSIEELNRMIIVRPFIAFVARDVSTNAEMIEFGILRAQADFDVTQAFAKRQLRKRHAKILIQMRKGFGHSR
jgi:hypothetical protein